MTNHAIAAHPAFIRESPLLQEAHRFAQAAHHGPANEGDTEIDHPEEVARLLYEADFSETVVAAALLHDVVEDTAIDLDEICRDFGSGIEALVGQMTENEGITSYEERKAEHRDRIAQDRRVAAIYAADKVANTRAIRDGDQEPDRERVAPAAGSSWISRTGPCGRSTTTALRYASKASRITTRTKLSKLPISRRSSEGEGRAASMS